jgi:uncharacterized protein (TIGR00299 family) protein
MILGALADLGLNPLDLHERLASLPVGPFDIIAEVVVDRGIRGTRVKVIVPTHDHHPHRQLADIRDLVEASELPERTKSLSLSVFQRLAEAEAQVHGTTPDRIHFHEVGAVDSIVDIVGSCLALDALGVEAVWVGALPDGHGTTRGSHGVLPIPVPAVVALLQGHPVTATDEPFEMVTPTAAALLMTWKALSPVLPSGDVVAAGYGVGHRRLNGRANVLRTTLLETGAHGPSAALGTEDLALVLETNLDDTTPEMIGALAQSLMEMGALDAFTTAAQMKKQRPGVLLTVLCRPADRERMLEAIFAGCTTFGVREHTVRRTVLDRRHETVKTPYGDIRIKLGFLGSRLVTRSPEYEDCLQAARTSGMPVRRVYETALAQALALPGDLPPPGPTGP